MNEIPKIVTSNARFSNSCLLYCGYKEKEQLPPFERKYILGNDIVEIIRKALK